MLAGDPAMTDPVCDKSPDHRAVEEAVLHAQRPVVDRRQVQALVFRGREESRRLIRTQQPEG
jgi:pyrroloquinoline quinone biosynthesis protein E